MTFLPEPRQAPHILIADDSRTQLVMLRNVLQQNGYEVVCANDGQEALQAAHETTPQLIISDIVMPVMDGYALCQAVKSDARLSATPVVLLTSLSDVVDIVRGLQSGADYYLTKPYDPDYLLATVARVFVHEQGGATEDALEVEVGGQRYSIESGRRQMLNLLLSTYGNAVEQNRVLTQTQQDLRAMNSQLVTQREQIAQQSRELQETNARLQVQATRDPLTNLRNRRALMERLHEECERARRHGPPLSLVLLDVDKFKTYNDSFGHPAGDAVLQEVSRLLEAQARGSDLVARYGGEEFAILLPQTNQNEAHITSERVRIAIEEATWPGRAVTISLGIATTPPLPPDPTTLLARADAALYESKARGRNQSTHSEEL